MSLHLTTLACLFYNFCTKTHLIFQKRAIFQLFYDGYSEFLKISTVNFTVTHSVFVHKLLYIILCTGYIICFHFTKHNLAFCNFSIIFFRSNILFVENFGTSLSEKSTISTKLSTMFFDLPAISYLSNLQNKLSLLSEYSEN